MVKSRLTRIVLIAAIACCVAPSAVDAAPAHKQDELLTATWKTVLETPDAENPFAAAAWTSHASTSDTASPLHRTVLRRAPSRRAPRCSSSGAHSSAAPSKAQDHGPGATPLRPGGRPRPAPSVTFHGHALRLTEVETPLVEATAPAGNLFGVPAGTKAPSSPTAGWRWSARCRPVITRSRSTTERNLRSRHRSRFDLVTNDEQTRCDRDVTRLTHVLHAGYASLGGGVQSVPADHCSAPARIKSHAGSFTA